MSPRRLLALAALVLLGAAPLAACRRDAGDGHDAREASIDSLSSPAAPGSSEPNLHADGDGTVHLSWIEPAADSAHALRFAVLGRDGWSAPRTIAEGRDFWLNWADFPSLVRLPGGRLAAHWLARSGAGTYDYDVRIAQSADGGATWSAGVLPYRERTRGEHGFVSLFAAGGDSLGALWLDGRGHDTTRAGATRQTMLAATTLAPDGSLGAERVVDARTCDCCQTDVAMTSRGPLAVYRDRDGREVRDILAARYEGGRWTEPRRVHRDEWVVDYCPVNGPAVSARGARVAVAWFTAARDTPRVNVAFSDDAGTTFGAPVRVDGGQPAGRVDVELGADGGAWVSWLERAGGEAAEVRLRQVRRDGTLGLPAVVARSSAARASGFPRMAPTRDGLLLAWTAAGEPSAVRVARVRLPAGR